MHDLSYYSEKDYQRELKRLISALSENKTPVEKPQAFLLGGQPGAGKSGLHGIILEHSNENIIIIDNDTYKQFHPNFKEITTSHSDYVPLVTSFSNRITEEIIDYFSNKKYNLTIEGTLRTTETPFKTATRLKNKNYDVNLYVMAVSKELSYIGTLARYEQQYSSKPKTARSTSKEHHDIVVDNMPANLENLFKIDIFNNIKIFNRDGVKLYDAQETPLKSPRDTLNKVLNGKVDLKELKKQIDNTISLAEVNKHQDTVAFKNLKEMKSKISQITQRDPFPCQD